MIVILKLITMGFNLLFNLLFNLFKNNDNPQIKVKKKSGKPFKSGLRENTVKDIIESPYVKGKSVYLFVEDDSMVEVDACEKVKEGS